MVLENQAMQNIQALVTACVAVADATVNAYKTATETAPPNQSGLPVEKPDANGQAWLQPHSNPAKLLQSNA